jgi:hypothetical protein
MPSRKEAKSAMIIIKDTSIKNSYSAFSTASLNASLFLLEYKNTWDTLKHRYIINSEVPLPGTYRRGLNILMLWLVTSLHILLLCLPLEFLTQQ